MLVAAARTFGAGGILIGAMTSVEQLFGGSDVEDQIAPIEAVASKKQAKKIATKTSKKIVEQADILCSYIVYRCCYQCTTAWCYTHHKCVITHTYLHVHIYDILGRPS